MQKCIQVYIQVLSHGVVIADVPLAPRALLQPSHDLHQGNEVTSISFHLPSLVLH